MKWCKLKSQKLSRHKIKNSKSIVSVLGFFFLYSNNPRQKLCIKPSKDMQDDTAWKQSWKTPPYMCY